MNDRRTLALIIVAIGCIIALAGMMVWIDTVVMDEQLREHNKECSNLLGGDAYYFQSNSMKFCIYKGDLYPVRLECGWDYCDMYLL